VLPLAVEDRMLTSEQILAMPAGPALDQLVEEAVFGRDLGAVTPDDRRIAISSSVPPGETLSSDRYPVVMNGVAYDLGGWSGQRYADYGIEPWPWAERFGKPWQADMEAHISAWRRPAERAYSSDISAAMSVLCKVRGPSQRPFMIQSRPTGGYGVMVAGNAGPVAGTGDTISEAICKAALLATLEAP
jgi:hypothetical protein